MTKGMVELSGAAVASILNGRLWCDNLDEMLDGLAVLTHAGPPLEWWGLVNARKVVRATATQLLLAQLPCAAELTDASGDDAVEHFIAEYPGPHRVLDVQAWAAKSPLQ